MRSPLECIAGSFASAVFTTYSLNLRFFEHSVLPPLHAAGVRNVIIFCDETQLGAALEDHGLRGVGRSYYVVSTRLGPGAFHPKLIFLHGERGTRACVSSANLTVDGQLRNVEVAVTLDSSEDGHRAALRDAASFLRRVGTEAPAHTVDALIAALPAAVDPDTLPPAELRLVHNLDSPLVDVFPVAMPEHGLTVVSPFADAGEAARTLSRRGALELVTDGDAFAAPEAFFSGSWTVVPRTFRPRRLHGKAYWSDEWLLVGSPNLSRPALLQTAAQGNTELAVVFTDVLDEFVDGLPGSEWTGRPLNELAPDRHRLERLTERERERIGSFDAWEEDGVIVVTGVADADLDHWDPRTNAWVPLGRLSQGRIEPPTDTRPHLIRLVEPNGRTLQAVVHRTRVLRGQRERPAVASRGATAISKLPLELQGVRALEDVLNDLYALESLTAEQAEQVMAATDAPKPTTGENEDLTEWRPAREEDEPRIPELYRRAWRGEQDTLLALIRKALRLGEPEQIDDESEILDEHATAGEDEEDETDDTTAEGPEPASAVPSATSESVLHRYRGALVKLLERGVEYVRVAREPALADLGFQAILRLHEELEQTEVTVDEELLPLVERSALICQKVRLLDAYLRERDGRDVNCLATARTHLGLCLMARDQMQPLEWEALERLAHERAADILESNPFAARAAQDAGVELGELELMIRPYAERADWAGLGVEAEHWLDDPEIGESPFPWGSGSDWFPTTAVSPAWKIVGYGAIVGWQHRSCYGVLVRNRQPKTTFDAHAVVVNPSTGSIHEAFRRVTDTQWVARTYTHVSEGNARKTASMGPDSILDDCTRSAYAEMGSAAAQPMVEFLSAHNEIQPFVESRELDVPSPHARD